MHSGSPPAAGQPLESIGLARRFELAQGRELWRVPDDDAKANELLELGALGLGGFIEGGRDEQGLWLIRAAGKDSVGEWLATRERAGAATSTDVPAIVATMLALARRLADAEARNLYPGPLGSRSAWLSEGVWLEAEPVVRALVGAPIAPHGSGSASLSRDWLTPEGAAGAAEHAGSNRWRLGLILYRALASQGPFAGLGLRSAIDQLARGVPPLPDAVAAGLPPGLHGLLLRMLDQDPARRPESAAAIVHALEAFSTAREGGEAPIEAAPRQDWQAAARQAVSARRAAVRVEPTPTPLRARPPDRRPLPFARVFGVLAVLVTGVGLGVWLLALPRTPGPASDGRSPKERGAVVVGTRAALDTQHTSADDCATCHPRQTSEWKRSVMGHSAKSPLFQGLEILIEEQVGRSDDCPGGAGILRTADLRTACRNPESNLPITGSGGALWCANCHTPRENLAASLPAWNGISNDASSRQPLRDLQPASTSEGIDCGFCHQVHGPVTPANRRYQGNPTWISSLTGEVFAMRPEDRGGVFGIANSGYALDPGELLVQFPGGGGNVPGDIHRRPSADARAYLQSSQFCGACHDVRLFGSDAIGAPTRGEHFRRLRNAYSEWVDWTALERRAGREPADCQDCHMSSFPGVCVPGDPPADPAGTVIASALRRGCPTGTHFESRAPGERPELRVAAGSPEHSSVTTHYFSGVDIPLTPEFDAGWIDQPTLDAAGIPLGAEQRRDLLLGRSFRFELGEVRLAGTTLEVPIEIENTGAGHKIPAGFSQEREFWVHLRITDAAGRLIYEVGRVDRGDEDLRDKLFLRVNVDDRIRDGAGRPLGVFGADVIDGPDHAEWQPILGRPDPEFRGRGLINFQNGFLRCVQCIGFIDGAGRCQPNDEFQAATRAGRFADGDFDDETGECRSNLSGREALFETYFPVGGLDASRGLTRGPDAIIDERSAPPYVTQRWTYALGLGRGVKGPFRIEARLMFRAFPPFLIRAFADYERLQAARGLRPSGALVTEAMLAKLDAVEILAVTREVDF